MGSCRTEIVSVAINVTGHDRDIVRSILPIVHFTKFQTCYLGNRISFICRLDLTVHQVLFLHWLRGKPRINAGRSQEQQFLHAVNPGALDDVVLDREVVVHEISQSRFIGCNTADLCRRQHDILRFLLLKVFPDRRLFPHIQLPGAKPDDVFIAFFPELPFNGRTHLAAAAGDKDLSVFVHCFHLFRSLTMF